MPTRYIWDVVDAYSAISTIIEQVCMVISKNEMSFFVYIFCLIIDLQNAPRVTNQKWVFVMRDHISVADRCLKYLKFQAEDGLTGIFCYCAMILFLQ